MLRQELKKCFSSDASLIILLCICLLATGFYWCSAYTPYMGDDYYPSDYTTLVQEYSTAEALGSSSDDMEIEYSLALEDVQQEWEDISGYQEYIKSVTQESFFGLQQESAYQTKLQEQYCSHYADLTDIVPVFSGNRGIMLFADIDLCDGILLFGIFLILFRLVTIDRETEMEPLLFCTENGTFRLYQYKWLAGSALTIGLSLFFYIIKVFIYTRAYCFQDWNGYLQSVPGYLSADVSLHIWQFVLLVILGKIFVLWLLYSVFYQINFRIFSYRKAFLLDLILCGISIVMVAGIHANSPWANVKLFSPVQMFDLGYLLSGYYPLKLFGYPVSYFLVWCLVCIVVMLCILYLILFPGCYQKRYQIPMNTGKRKQTKVFSFSRISGSFLFSWEWKKWMRLDRGIYLLLALVFMVFATYHLPQESIESREDRYYKALVSEYHGEVTEGQQSKAANALEELEKLQQDMFEHGGEYTTTAYEVASQKTEKIPALKRLIAYQKYVSKRSGRKLVYEKGYEMLFGKSVSGSYLKWCNVLAVIFLCLMSESLWGLEKKSGMESLCSATLVGIKKINRRKIMALFLVSVLIGLIVYLPWIYLAAQSYQMQDWNVAVDSLRIFRGFSQLTIGAALALYYSLHIIYLFVAGMVMKVIRNRMNSSMIAILVVCLIGLLPCLWIS